MLVRGEKPITKEQYERAQLNGGYINEADMTEIFSQAELCGYGIYAPIAYKHIDATADAVTYSVKYSTGATCD